LVNAVHHDPLPVEGFDVYRWRCFAFAIVLFAAGCGKESTARLIENLKAPDPLTRLKAVRTLPQRQEDAAQIIPALMEALKNDDGEVRRGAAFGLGAFSAQARAAVPALQAALRDREPEVRKAASVALAYIDPQFAAQPASANRRGK
jgi:vesicle coat complex subunit